MKRFFLFLLLAISLNTAIAQETKLYNPKANAEKDIAAARTADAAYR